MKTLATGGDAAYPVAMRGPAWAVLLVCGVAAAASAADPRPSAVTYLLGGLSSGPYRLYVDLDAGRLSEARPRPGTRGDGARVPAASLPETARRALTAAERDTLRRLAVPVWRDGAARAGCFGFNMDALVVLAITTNGAERRTDAPTQCLTPDALRLQQALLCTANPGSGGCP